MDSSSIPVPKKSRIIAAVACVIIAVSCTSVVGLFRISESLNLRGLSSAREKQSGMVVWALATTLLVLAGYFLGKYFRTRLGPVRPVVPALIAIGVPIAAAIFALNFEYPLWWPRWLDTEFVGTVLVLSGGVLAVLVFRSLAGTAASGISKIARALLGAWGTLIMIVGTWSVLFLE